MAFCSDCRSLSIDYLRLGDYPWKGDLVKLKDAAENDCPLCLLCWTGFQRHCGEDIQEHMVTIRNRKQKGRDLQIYMVLLCNEAEYDQDLAYCDGRTFSPCEIEVRIGPDPKSPYDHPFLRTTRLCVFAEPGTCQDTRSFEILLSIDDFSRNFGGEIHSRKAFCSKRGYR